MGRPHRGCESLTSSKLVAQFGSLLAKDGSSEQYEGASGVFAWTPTEPTILADHHLNAGDYALTRIVFGLIIVAAIGMLLGSIVLARGLNRLLGLSIAAVLVLAAVRTIVRWKDVVEASAQFTDGRPGHEVQWSEAGQFVRSSLGDLAVFSLILLTIALIMAACASRVDPHYNSHRLVD
jgi:hypothetical protein